MLVNKYQCWQSLVAELVRVLQEIWVNLPVALSQSVIYWPFWMVCCCGPCGYVDLISLQASNMTISLISHLINPQLVSMYVTSPITLGDISLAGRQQDLAAWKGRVYATGNPADSITAEDTQNPIACSHRACSHFKTTANCSPVLLLK